MTEIVGVHIKPIIKADDIFVSPSTDADYCAMGHQCHEKASCLNVSPKYSCHCEKGFQGDGFNCTGELSPPNGRSNRFVLDSHVANQFQTQTNVSREAASVVIIAI